MSNECFEYGSYSRYSEQSNVQGEFATLESSERLVLFHVSKWHKSIFLLLLYFSKFRIKIDSFQLKCLNLKIFFMHTTLLVV